MELLRFSAQDSKQQSHPRVDNDFVYTMNLALLDHLCDNIMQAQKGLVGKRSGGQGQTREFSAALVKARGDALTSRARAFALQQRLDQVDVSGLQVRPAPAALSSQPFFSLRKYYAFSYPPFVRSLPCLSIKRSD